MWLHAACGCEANITDANETNTTTSTTTTTVNNETAARPFLRVRSSVLFDWRTSQ